MERNAKSVRVSWMAGALLPLAAGITSAANGSATSSAVPAQAPSAQQAAAPMPTAPSGPRLERAKDLLGAKIVNGQGDQIGVVADVVLTPDRDAVSYVVLSTGWAWGLPDKYFAVPWSQFQLPPGGKGKVLILKGVSWAQLDQAKGFNKAHWPPTASVDWLREEQRYLRPAPGGGYAALPPINVQNLRLSKLLGTTVRNPRNGVKLGTLEGVMIDTNQGRVAYGVVVLRHGFLGLNREYAPVPWPALDLIGRPGVAWLDTTKQTLMAVASNRDNFPNLENPRYSRQLEERFPAAPYRAGQSLGYVPGYVPGEGSPTGGPSRPYGGYEHTYEW
jgi:sporulation protein YlmC with PRC-barrel domain